MTPSRLVIPHARASAAVAIVSALAAYFASGSAIGQPPEPPTESIQGWTVKLDPRLLLDEHAKTRQLGLAVLDNHLLRIALIVPEQRLKQLRRLPIWVEINNPALARIGKENMQYHPDRGWLVRNGLDPRLERHVHIPRIERLSDRATWEKHPYVVLHELAHAFHDQVLGFDHAEIQATFEAAKARGEYDKVLLFNGRRVQHYGMTNAKEYFAESTEAFFGVNDFYPFVRAELAEFDPKMADLLHRIWGVPTRR